MANPVLIALIASATFCAYDPSSARPNPLGMRAYVSIYYAAPRLTSFLYDNFGNVVHDGAAKRKLTLHVSLAQARAVMRKNPSAWAALTGSSAVDPNDDTYARLDPLLKCSPAKAFDLRHVNDPARVTVAFYQVYLRVYQARKRQWYKYNAVVDS